MSEWDAFDGYDHGPGDTVPVGDLDLGALAHGGPDLGELDHGALDAGLTASLDPGEHDPLLADPLTDPLAEHDPVSVGSWSGHQNAAVMAHLLPGPGRGRRQDRPDPRGVSAPA